MVIAVNSFSAYAESNLTGRPSTSSTDLIAQKYKGYLYDMDEEYFCLMFNLKLTDIDSYNEALEGMGAEEKGYLLEHLAIKEEEFLQNNQITSVSCGFAESDEDNTGRYAYILDMYNIDVVSLSDEELVREIQQYTYSMPDSYLDILDNIPDSDYNRYFMAYEKMTADGRLAMYAQMTPYTISDDGEIISGEDIMFEADKDGLPVVPENIIFLLTCNDGTKSYVYVDDVNMAVSTDTNGYTTFTYTESGKGTVSFTVALSVKGNDNVPED